MIRGQELTLLEYAAESMFDLYKMMNHLQRSLYLIIPVA